MGSESSKSCWNRVHGKWVWYHGTVSGVEFGSLVLSTFVLEPGLDLSLCHSQSYSKHLAISWQQILLILKSLLQCLNLLWAESHPAFSNTALILVFYTIQCGVVMDTSRIRMLI